MKERFIQFRWYEENFDYLFNFSKTKEINDKDLMPHCIDSQNILSLVTQQILMWQIYTQN